ncbi:DUF2949 domain-containing protein [Acaryochloris sp. IP29b_bin.148]|uniref:DUF2949 domain-containing protein n=1 Tax=Acaryochloris sp. IP29b_bin.148 TaxID=2969218 RepID=UPI002610C538|nr:DUF2949 domain-containing protein [Acaryochloris sp. IP29b_bin.148]
MAVSRFTKESSPPTLASQKRLLTFLQEELALPNDSIGLALRHLEQDPGPLPIVLWQYGLITLDQLNQIYDWLENT